VKKVLVTGAGGFIGSHLTELLVQEGFNVKAFVRYNSKNSWGWLDSSEVKDNVEVITGDIRDYDSVYNALKECSAVFHLAALIGIPYSYVSPKAYIQTNITGTYNVLQSSRDLGLEQTLIASTAETYGNAQYMPVDEKHPVVGQSPYAASKIAADQIAISYFRSFDLPVKIVKCFNTFGPRQSARAIIPTIITQILNGNKILQLGNLAPTRDLTFVLDTVEAYLNIYKSDKLFGEITHVGMGIEVSIKDLINLITGIMKTEITVIPDKQRIRPENSEVERLKCNNTKIFQSTAWKPKYDLKMGLEKTVQWLQNNLNQYKPELYNI
jgi:NAD dependent epimerase/dehydratase